MNLEGKWKVQTNNTSTTDAVKMDGVLTISPSGNAWDIRIDLDNGKEPVLGVGFVNGNFLCVARGIVTQKAELGETVGLVEYDISTLGNLPARWYHPSLAGTISKGISTHGPTDTLVGEYQADYSSKEGVAYDALRKTIIDLKTMYQFSWWNNSRFHYVGTCTIVNDYLYVAWSAPGSIVQFVHYDLTNTENAAVGAWSDFARNKFGSESLDRIES